MRSSKIINLSLLVILVLTGSVCFAYSGGLPVSNGKSPFVKVVKDLSESVVNIKVESEQQTNPTGKLPFDDFFKFYFPQNPRPQKSVSMGSGFIFKKSGKKVYILTNNHVVSADDASITVTLADKAKFNAKVVGKDPLTDLAVISIEVNKDEKIVVAPLGSSENLDIGDWAIAIGNPFGELGLERTVTVGVISATGRSKLNFGQGSPLYQDYIQTDAAINPGNSGGPLINISGEVIGVNAAITSSVGGNIGIGFAIPVDIAKKVAEDFLDKGRVVRAYLGILPQEMDETLKNSLKLKKIYGVLVAKVESDTPAEKAGLKKGDVIVKINNENIPDVAKFRLLVASSPINKRIPLTVVRKGKEKQLSVKLSEFPTKEKITQRIPDKSKNMGITVSSLDSDFARKFKLSSDKGVIVSQIDVDTPAKNSGLSVGDVILEINNTEIKGVSDFNKKMKKSLDSKQEVILFYVIGLQGQYKYVAINIK